MSNERKFDLANFLNKLYWHLDLVDLPSWKLILQQIRGFILPYNLHYCSTDSKVYLYYYVVLICTLLLWTNENNKRVRMREISFAESIFNAKASHITYTWGSL